MGDFNESVYIAKIGSTSQKETTVRKRQLTFGENIIRKEGIENLILTGYRECKRCRVKQQVTFCVNGWQKKDKKRYFDVV